MIPAVYVIMLEAAVCGLMINRTLCSRSRKMWHLPLYILIKTSLCSLAVYLNGTELITVLCIALSFLYAMSCFSDRLSRKLLVIFLGSLCIGISNLFKFFILDLYGLTQRYHEADDVLASVICIAFSMLVFTVLTVIATNAVCRVRPTVILIISAVMLLVLLFSGFVYNFMHSLIDVQLNSVFTAYALIYLLPAIVLLYFFEAVTFSTICVTLQEKKRMAVTVWKY